MTEMQRLNNEAAAKKRLYKNSLRDNIPIALLPETQAAIAGIGVQSAGIAEAMAGNFAKDVNGSAPSIRSTAFSPIVQMGKDCLAYLQQTVPNYVKRIFDSVSAYFGSLKDNFTKMPKQWQTFLITMAIYCTIIFVSTYYKSKQTENSNLTKALGESVNATLTYGLSMGTIIGGISCVFQPFEHICQLLGGLCVQDTVVPIATFSSAFLFGFIWDISCCIYQSTDRTRQWSKLEHWYQFITNAGSKLSSNIASYIDKNAFTAATFSATLYLFPVYGTFFSLLLVPVIYCHVDSERVKNGSNSLLFTALRVTGEVLICPFTRILYLLDGANVQHQYPDELLDEITDLPLTDPVFLRGYLVNRAIATLQINSRQRDYFNCPATLDDIKDVPGLRDVVNQARRLIEV